MKRASNTAVSFKNRATERWATAGEFAIDMVAVHARLAEEVIMPNAEEMEANLGLGFRSIQTCLYAKRLSEDAKEILAWKAMMIQRGAFMEEVHALVAEQMGLEGELFEIGRAHV